MKSIVLLSLVLVGLSGCSVGQMPSADKEYGWYVEHRFATDDKVYYCKANKTDKGPVPQCFEADMKKININAQVGIL